MALTLVSSFVHKQNKVLPLNSDAGVGAALRVASLTSDTLGSLTAQGVSTVNWSIRLNPNWVTITPDSIDPLKCNILFDSAQPQTNPYQFYIVASGGTEVKYFPITLDVKEPFRIGKVGGGSVISMQSYDSTIADVEILGYGLGDTQVGGVRFLTPDSLPNGLNFITVDESKGILRVNEVTSIDISGGLKLSTGTAVSEDIVLKAYKVGSMYDTPERTFDHTLTIQSTGAATGALDFAVSSFYDSTHSYIRFDLRHDYLDGMGKTLTYTWAPSATLTISSGGTTSDTFAIYTVATTGDASLTLTIKDALNATVGTKTIGPFKVSTSADWSLTNAIKLNVESLDQGFSGSVVNFTVSSPAGEIGGAETYYVDFTIETGGHNEGTITAPSQIQLTAAAPSTTVALTIPATSKRGEKWVLKATAANDPTTPTRTGYAQGVLVSNGLQLVTLSVANAAPSAVTGSSMTPVTLTSEANAVLFLVGAPDGVSITNAQLMANVLTAGSYSFVVGSTLTNRSRNYVPVTLTVAESTPPMEITSVTSSVVSVADNEQFTIHWGVTANSTPDHLYLLQNNGTRKEILGATQTIVTEVGTSVYSVYGHSYYGDSYSVPVVVISGTGVALGRLITMPTIASIDENNKLQVNWQVPPVNGGYGIYKGWNIWIRSEVGGTPNLQMLSDGSTPTGLEVEGTVNDARAFEAQLATIANAYICMQTLSTDLGVALDSNPWDSYHKFPSALGTSYTISKSSLQRNEPFTITLNPAFDGADTWRVTYPDNTNTGWLPISVRSVTKAFSEAGSKNIVIEVENSYAFSDPSVKLRRSLAKTLYVVDQMYLADQGTEGELLGALGFGGEAGFEITNALGTTVVPEAYATIVRALVKDEITNEVKLLIATARSRDASSMLGTMAVDAFPLQGRPHDKNFIDIAYTVSADGVNAGMPVRITTEYLPELIAGKVVGNIQLQATEGVKPYAWYADNLPFGLRLMSDGTLMGTAFELGIFTVLFSVKDSSQVSNIDEKTIQLVVTTDLTITTENLTDEVVGQYCSESLQATGGVAPLHWSVVAGELPHGIMVNPDSGILSGVPCTYNSDTDFTKAFTATFQVVDSIGAKTSKTLSVNLKAMPLTVGEFDQSTIYTDQNFKLVAGVYGGTSPYTLTTPVSGVSLVDGQLEAVTHFDGTNQGMRSYTFSVADSGSLSVQRMVNFTVDSKVSEVLVNDYSFEHIWNSATDSTAISLDISGNFSGYTLAVMSSTSVGNGLHASINAGTKKVIVTGPPTQYGNTEFTIPITLQKNGVTVAVVNQRFTLISHLATNRVAGNEIYETHPYLVGDRVALNPLKPYFNSPALTKGSLLVNLQDGSKLPLGLSLDHKTGLIYGNLAGAPKLVSAYTTNFTSVLEYRSGDNTLVSAITVNWYLLPSEFTLGGDFTAAYLNTPYSSEISPLTSSDLSTVTLLKGSLPSGLALSISGTDTVLLSGTPTSAGYYDAWIKAVNASGQSAYYYKRFKCGYVTPLAIVTSTLPPFTVSSAYTTQLLGAGGVTPYVWTLDSSSPALPTGLTLSSAGVLSGTTAVSSYSQSIVVRLTDSRGTTLTKALQLTTIALTITTTALPNITTNAAYSFALSAAGGVKPYTWSLNTGSPALPSGFSLNASTGVISGTTASTNYDQNVVFKVQDNVNTTATKSLRLYVQSGSSSPLTITKINFGDITLGVPFQGILGAAGGTPNYSWAVSPSSAHQLPTGLSLVPTGDDLNAFEYVAGTVTTPILSGTNIVTIQCVDNSGNHATLALDIYTVAGLTITTQTLPTATVNTAYSTQLTASGNVGTVSWAMVGGSTLPSGFSLTSAGVLQGQGASASSTVIRVVATDSVTSVTKSLTLIVQSSGITITTSTPFAIKSNQTFSQSMSATGGTTPYQWSIVSGTVPTGLQMSLTGVWSGTTTAIGTFSDVVIRAVDHNGLVGEKVFSFNITSPASLMTGWDYTNAIRPLSNSLGWLSSNDDASSIVGSNKAFSVVVVGANAYNSTDISINVPTGVTATIDPFSGTYKADVYVKLTGATLNTLSTITVGASIKGSPVPSATFNIHKYNSSALTVTPLSGSFPDTLPSGGSQPNAVLASLSVSPADTLSGNRQTSDVISFTVNSSPLTGYTVFMYGTKNGVADLVGQQYPSSPVTPSTINWTAQAGNFTRYAVLKDQAGSEVASTPIVSFSIKEAISTQCTVVITDTTDPQRVGTNPRIGDVVSFKVSASDGGAYDIYECDTLGVTFEGTTGNGPKTYTWTATVLSEWGVSRQVWWELHDKSGNTVATSQVYTITVAPNFILTVDKATSTEGETLTFHLETGMAGATVNAVEGTMQMVVGSPVAVGVTNSSGSLSWMKVGTEGSGKTMKASVTTANSVLVGSSNTVTYTVSPPTVSLALTGATLGSDGKYYASPNVNVDYVFRASPGYKVWMNGESYYSPVIAGINNGPMTPVEMVGSIAQGGSFTSTWYTKSGTFSRWASIQSNAGSKIYTPTVFLVVASNPTVSLTISGLSSSNTAAPGTSLTFTPYVSQAGYSVYLAGTGSYDVAYNGSTDAAIDQLCPQPVTWVAKSGTFTRYAYIMAGGVKIASASITFTIAPVVSIAISGGYYSSGNYYNVTSGSTVTLTFSATAGYPIHYIKNTVDTVVSAPVVWIPADGNYDLSAQITHVGRTISTQTILLTVAPLI